MMPLGAADERCPGETIVVDIASLPLTPGDYYLRVAPYGEDGVVVGEVQRAAEFSVIPADILGSGYHFTQKDGQFTIPWEWELGPSNADRVA